MPSTDRKLELKAKDINGSDRLTASCVSTDLAAPAIPWMAVYAKGLAYGIQVQLFREAAE
jgi:hypothetical protein